MRRGFFLEKLFFFAELPHIVIFSEQVSDRQDPGVKRMILILVLVHACATDEPQVLESLQALSHASKSFSVSEIVRGVRVFMPHHECAGIFLSRDKSELDQFVDRERNDILIAFFPERITGKAEEFDTYGRRIRIPQHIGAESAIIPNTGNAKINRLDIEPRVSEQVLAVHYHVDRDVSRLPSCRIARTVRPSWKVTPAAASFFCIVV